MAVGLSADALAWTFSFDPTKTADIFAGIFSGQRHLFTNRPACEKNLDTRFQDSGDISDQAGADLAAAVFLYPEFVFQNRNPVPVLGAATRSGNPKNDCGKASHGFAFPQKKMTVRHPPEREWTGCQKLICNSVMQRYIRELEGGGNCRPHKA